LDADITFIVFDASSKRNPVNIHIYLVFLETRVTEQLYAADSMGLSLLKFSWWAP